MRTASYIGPAPGSLGGVSLREWETLSQETDSQLREEGLLGFATRLEQAENLEAAVHLYNSLVETGSLGAKEGAQRRLDAIFGRGSFGERFEFLARRFVKEATSLQVILPMMAGSMVYQIGKGFALSRMTAASNPSWWMQGMTGNWAASALGFSLEVPAFVFSGRAIRQITSSPQGPTELSHELGSAALTLGLLKVGGALGQTFLQKTLGNVPAPLTRAVVSQATLFGGLLAAHQIETGLGWRPVVVDATTLTDIFSSMVSLGVGGRLANYALGPKSAVRAMELDLRMRNRTNAKIFNPPNSPWGPGLLVGSAMPNSNSKAMALDLGPKDPVRPILMSSRRDHEGEDPQSLDLKPSEKVQLAIYRVSKSIPIYTRMWNIQLTLAYAEAVRDPSAAWLQKLADPNYWKVIKNKDSSIPYNIRSNIDLLFEGYFLKLKDGENFLNNEKWEQLETEFLLYCNICRPLARPKISFLEFQNLLLERRHSVLAAKEIQDSLAPVSYEGLPKDHRDFPFFWLRQDVESKNLLQTLAEKRKGILHGESPAPLQEAMAENIPFSHRLQRLKKLKAFTPFSSLIRKRESRPVIWNPFHVEHRDSLVIHPHHGEGLILSENDGKISVQFSDAPPVILGRSTVAAPREVEKYQAIIAERLQKNQILPHIYTLLALRPYLGDRERSDFLDNFRTATVDVPFYHQSEPCADAVNNLANIIGGTGSFNRLSVPLQKHLKEALFRVADLTGIDPITFALRLMVGENPYEVVIPTQKKPKNKTHARAMKNRNMTPDLIRELLRARPWVGDFAARQKPGTPNVISVGHYYPEYYSNQASQPHDLTELYFAFRNGETEAFQAVVNLFQEPVQAWMSEKGRSTSGVLVPMIGQAPLNQLGEQLSYPVVFPWLDRPVDYGRGVEGQRAAVKMRMVQKALRLNPEISEQIRGRPVLVLDDNGTDFITWMWARKLLLDAGASEAGLVVLTQTQRTPQELDWSLRR